MTTQPILSEEMALFEKFVVDKVNTIAPFNNSLHEAMTYALQSGGKRFRPLLLLNTVALSNKSIEVGLPAAAAIEWIHTYSLVHDDLPAMDNDDYRRGKPTTHKKFDEATAILAGDALLTGAFQLVLEQDNLSVDVRVQMGRLLAKASGSDGMVAGQVADIEGEKQTLTLEQLETIHHKKTGELIQFAVEAGALIGELPVSISTHLKAYSQHVGLAFQIHNDLKDVLLPKSETGKTIGRDEELGKNTYPSLLGTHGALEKLTEEVDAAVTAIESVRHLIKGTDYNEAALNHFLALLDYVQFKGVEYHE